MNDEYYEDADVEIMEENTWVFIICPRCKTQLFMREEITCNCGMVFELVKYVVIKDQ